MAPCKYICVALQARKVVKAAANVRMWGVVGLTPTTLRHTHAHAHARTHIHKYVILPTSSVMRCMSLPQGSIIHAFVYPETSFLQIQSKPKKNTPTHNTTHPCNPLHCLHPSPSISSTQDTQSTYVQKKNERKREERGLLRGG